MVIKKDDFRRPEGRKTKETKELKNVTKEINTKYYVRINYTHVFTHEQNSQGFQKKFTIFIQFFFIKNDYRMRPF